MSRRAGALAGIALTATVAAIAQAGSVARAETVRFDESPVGQPPAGWLVALTGRGESKWTVEAEGSAPSPPLVLKQSGIGTFPICLKDGTDIADGFVEVSFRPVSGREDQAGGVIWRARDSDNYYIARANVLEDNVTIYHMIGGRRVAFENTNARVTPGTWHKLRVDFSGSRFVVSFDGKTVIDANDTSLTGGGKVGLWTKADSVTLFDDFTFGPRAR
jgi:hypothetical protein